MNTVLNWYRRVIEFKPSAMVPGLDVRSWPPLIGHESEVVPKEAFEALVFKRWVEMAFDEGLELNWSQNYTGQRVYHVAKDIGEYEPLCIYINGESYIEALARWHLGEEFK